MPTPIPTAWQPILAEESAKPYYARLQEFVADERASHTVFPPEPDVFNALALTPYDQARVLLLGQDPYPTPGHPIGLSFAVAPDGSVSVLDTQNRRVQRFAGGRLVSSFALATSAAAVSRRAVVSQAGGRSSWGTGPFSRGTTHAPRSARLRTRRRG